MATPLEKKQFRTPMVSCDDLKWLPGGDSCRCAVDFQVLSAFSAAAESNGAAAEAASGHSEARGSKVLW